STPFTALAPHSVAPGPLMTSIRSMSASGTSCTSQNTPENKGVYTVRPSMSTKSLLAVVLLKPRALMAHWRESTCAPCKLVSRRQRSSCPPSVGPPCLWLSRIIPEQHAFPAQSRSDPCHWPQQRSQHGGSRGGS